MFTSWLCLAVCQSLFYELLLIWFCRAKGELSQCSCNLSSCNSLQSIMIVFLVGHLSLEMSVCCHLIREAGGPQRPESPCPCGQLSAGVWDERMHQGASCIHSQGLQVSTRAGVYCKAWKKILIMVLNNDFPTVPSFIWMMTLKEESSSSQSWMLKQ